MAFEALTEEEVKALESALSIRLNDLKERKAETKQFLQEWPKNAFWAKELPELDRSCNTMEKLLKKLHDIHPIGFLKS